MNNDMVVLLRSLVSSTLISLLALLSSGALVKPAIDNSVSNPANAINPALPVESEETRHVRDQLQKTRGKIRREIAAHWAETEAMHQPTLAEALRNLSRFGIITAPRQNDTALDKLMDSSVFLKKKLMGKRSDWLALLGRSKDNQYLELAIQNRDWRRYIALFEKNFARSSRDQIPEYLRMHYAIGLEALGFQQKALKVIEGLANWYPTSDESVWAFQKLSKLMYENPPAYTPSLSLLRGMARNDLPGNGVQDFIAFSLQSEIEDRWGRKRHLTPLEKFRFFIEIRRYDLAFSLIEQISKPGTSNKSFDDEIRIARTYEETAHPTKAIHHLLKQQPKARNQKQRFEVDYLLAHILLRQRSFDEASVVFGQIKSAPRNKVSAKWYQFLSYYRAANFVEAEAVIESGQLFSTHSEFSGARDYWMAKIKEKTGESTKAAQLLKDLVSKHPDSYYAMMAISRFPKLGEQLVVKRRISELNAASRQIAKRDNSKAHQFQAVRLLASLNSNIVPINLGEEPGEQRMVDGMYSKYIDDYPLLEQDMQDYLSHSDVNDLYFKHAIIKAESSFKRDAISPVGARGLMQIMPYTARKIADRIGDPFFDLNLLTLPQVNLIYGSFYLDFLSTKLGSLPVVAATYNAGPRAVKSWLERCQDCLVDEWVELIPYTETRRYVKRMTENLSIYSRIYSSRYPQIDLQLLPTPLSMDNELF